MPAFLLSRFLQSAVLLVIVSIIGFTVLNLMPGGPLAQYGLDPGMTMDDMELIEINEAFAAQVIACHRKMPFDMERLNVHGGAIALGHPIGASGAKILTTLLYALKRQGKSVGMAATLALTLKIANQAKPAVGVVDNPPYCPERRPTPMPKTTPTLAEIATAAGVSTMTASRAVNHQPGVSRSTRDAILKLAHNMGYVANRSAQKLSGGRSRVIGLLAADLGNAFTSALVSGAVCLAKEAAPRGVRVNCISPGLVQGPMMDATVEQLGQSFLEKEQPLYPLGFGKPQDVASMAAFMLSQEASWLTGQNIMLAGGR